MAQTGTQQTKNQCCRCGRSFDSPQDLRDHEKNCKPATNPGSAEPAQSEKKAEQDMMIEDRFEASDN